MGLKKYKGVIVGDNAKTPGGLEKDGNYWLRLGTAIQSLVKEKEVSSGDKQERTIKRTLLWQSSFCD